MSSTIDERIVAMKFDNKQFEAGAKTSMNTLDQLSKSLKMEGATKGLQDVDAAAKKLSLQGIADGVENISSKFKATGVIAVAALASIATKAVDVGAQLIKSLSLDPLKQGLEEYETNLNAIQTILANTQSKGTTLDNVNTALEQLNAYSDKTIYNFSEMARNIGTFTAAGVDLDTSVNAIKGIANLAALSGSNSQQASTAMYQLSQALSTGTVKLMDWNSVVNAGMGGELFQNAIKETARVHGVAVDSIIEEQGSFRDSLQTGWLTSEILTETLSKLTGDLTDSQLEAMGYTQEQIVEIQKMAQTASDAATKVKTFTQLIGTLKEAQGSGWSKSFQIIFGDFEEAKELWTGVNNVLGGMISASADARNQLLSDWKEAGGRTAAIEAVKGAFEAVMAVLKPLKEAFREIFPPATGQQLADITMAIRDFILGLKIGEETAAKLKSVFKGVFAAFDIGIIVIKAIGGMLAQVFGELFSGNTGKGLDKLASIGDRIVALRDRLRESMEIGKFFSDIGDFLVLGIQKIKDFLQYLGAAFDIIRGGGADALGDSLERVQTRLEPLSRIGKALEQTWESIWNWMKKTWEVFAPLRDAIGQFFTDLGGKLTESFATMDFNGILDLVNTGLFAGLVLIAKKFLSNGINVDVGGGLLDTIRGTFGALTDTLGAMQQQLKADALMKIAAAIGILTLSVVALSLIDSAKLTKALVAITVMFAQLAGAMALLDRVSTTGSAVKLGILAAGLILLGGAILILSASVAIFASMEWEELARGFAGLTASLLLIAGFAKAMENSSAPMIRTGIAVGILAGGLILLAGAVKLFSMMEWGDMAKGFAGITAALVAMGLFTKLVEANKGAISGAVSILILAGALMVITEVVKRFADMSWEDIGKGMAAMAASLAILAGALYLMTGTLAGAAAAIVASVAILILSKALESFSQMSWEEIAKAAVMLAGALLVIAGGLYLMTAAIPGALALAVVAGSLALLGPVLVAFGNMEWESIGKGLVMLAGVFLVIGVAGALLTPVIPTLLGLGIAIALIGVGVMAAGLGLLAFSAGLTALSVAGAAGAVAITAILSAVIGAIPQVFAAIANGIVELAGILTNAAPVFLEAAVVFLTTLLTAIGIVIPKAVETIVILVMALVNGILALVPFLVDAGYKLIIGLINGIARNIPGIVTAATNLISAFITSLGQNALRLVNTAAETVITFLNGIATAIRTYSPQIEAAGRNIASAIIEGMTGGLSRGISTVANKAKEVAQGALNAAKKLLGIASPSKEFFKVGLWSDEGLAGGMDKGTNVVEASAEAVAQSALDMMKKTLANAGDVIANDMNTQPVIRPVLDLTDIRKGSQVIDGLLTPTAIAPSTSYTKASSIVADTRAQEEAAAVATLEAPIQETNLTYNQYNSSPKAISSGEVYRQTKNQLSTVKEALPK